MRHMHMKALGALLLLVACASGLSAEQRVFEAKANFRTTLVVAATYAGLPNCTRAPSPCSNTEVVRQIDALIPAIRVSLDTAEAIVRSGGNAEAQLAHASAGLVALASVLPKTGAPR